jgi:predicted acyl esterase
MVLYLADSVLYATVGILMWRCFRADVYLPRNSAGPFPVLLGASPYQKSLRHLPPVPATFPFIEYGPMQLCLDEGYAYVAMDTPGMGRSEEQ